MSLTARRRRIFACVLVLLLAGGAANPGLAQQREAAPSGEEKAIETESGKIKINFPEMDLESVLKNFSAITGKSFVLEKMPAGEVHTIGPIGPVEIPKEEAYKFFVLILNINGYSVVPTSVPGVFKVVKSAEALKENIPVYPPGAPSPPTTEEMVTRFVQLKYVQASEIAPQLAQLASKNGGQVIPYPPTNTLIILDTALNISRILKILKYLDVPSPEPEVEIVYLKFADPSETANILGQIFPGSGPAPSARTATTKRTSRGQRASTSVPVPTQAASPIAGLPKFIPVDRLNGLVVISTPDLMESIKDFIKKLDVDVGATQTIYVYYVQNAEASELAATLSSLTGGGRTIRSAVTQTRSSTGSLQESAKPVPPPTRSREPVSGTISGILKGEVSITADDATNSLIVVATPQDWQVLLEVIKKLDIPRRQVFVEAVLLEITYNESKEFGTSVHGASPLEDSGVVFSGTGFSDVSSLTLLSSLAGGSFVLPSGITLGAIGRPVEIPGAEGAMTVPSAGLILRLLASESNVNVLSTPTLLTTDNEEAVIEVGQRIPVPTGQTVSTGGLSSISISRESVGIKLRITPQVNESDAIRLKISTEISNAVSSPLGIDVNTLGVVTSNKTAETTVIVKDSQTIVIGGLMEDRRNQSESRVPFLGDIPVLGWLFKSGSKGRSKSNLIILLTPHIVRSDEEVERVKKRIKKTYDDIMEEEIGADRPDWDRYWESQMKEDFQGPTIDFRGGEPEVINPRPDWEWQPSLQAGETAEPSSPNQEEEQTLTPQPESKP